MVGIAVLLSLAIVLTLISNSIRIGSIEINLSLIPIVLASILYGPWAGLLIGVVNGGLVLIAPGTAAFLAINAPATVALCLIKTGFAGFLAGWAFKLASKWKLSFAVILSAIIVPVCNTGIFMLFVLLFFGELLGAIVSIMLLINFGIELGINIALGTTLVYLVRYFFARYPEFEHLQPVVNDKIVATNDK